MAGLLRDQDRAPFGVRSPWIPRNRPRAALAGALTQSAAASGSLRSVSPTDFCDEEAQYRAAVRFPNDFEYRFRSLGIPTEHIRVKVYTGMAPRQRFMVDSGFMTACCAPG